MSGRPKIDIVESSETLKKFMKYQKTSLGYSKVQSLYLLKSNQAKTVREIAHLLGKGETTIHRWFSFYRTGGIDFLLKERKSSGRPKKLSVETAARVQQELKAESEKVNKYQKISYW